MGRKIKIAPSILSANFASLGSEIEEVTTAGADYIHIDVMDGFFVPNLTIGPCVVSSIRGNSNAVFDVHLMATPVENLIHEFIKAGADIITVHYEAVTHLHNIINQIKLHGKKAGIAITPSTPVSVLEYIMTDIDLLLIMTVNPGFAGQKFINSQLRKISEAKSMSIRLNPDIDISVDGGINIDTATMAVKAGANVLVAGTEIFKKGIKDYKKNIENLRGI
ncbi:Ribulose-phosphate 3-epimerase [Candidatus Xenohaliotis californiensis]|uniref:Ribulose-phosphate 3-epimerase n=1 Tax=Candidatus Xenohaliotis californiensis TaxID=84677 RepID=A0ABP0ESQ3_9RICK|nr:Ribulose-phosphate 3-epimerase [Candidatus Xenohaliotis californiensis]